MNTVTLQQSHDFCAHVARTQARNFYYGMKLTPQPKRAAMYAVYAWMRQADDLADEPGDDAAKTARLQEFRRQTIDAVQNSKLETRNSKIWPAFVETVTTYDISLAYLHDMIDGQLMDMTRRRYKSFDQLYEYCYKVASVVGLTCIRIWGFDGTDETRKLAEWRGVAFQLTNILRDAREDATRDRVYLPADDFEMFEVNPAMFSFDVQPEALRGIQRTIERAGDYYRRSQPLDKFVHRDGRACLWAMTSIYRGIFEKIRKNPRAVLTNHRVGLSNLRKAWIALRARAKAVAR